MVAVSHNGTFGEAMAWSEAGMNQLLQQKEVKHVEVFVGTQEEIDKRNAFRKNLKVKNRSYKK